ncbi:MAG: hypothetical protein PHD88_08495 [Firmicutes bacterium]|nr:hypothetical protein [Bacillota bacterium]MDD4694415.1 hypothetical protein [Bacillota bacterium]
MQKTERSKKTIIVIDEQGNKYEATYPRRAKGLVKSGRARLIDDNKICLLDPPKKPVWGENTMTDQEKKLDLSYIVEKIDEIICINTKMASDLSIKDNNESVIEGITEITNSNNKVLSFLREIYQDIKPEKQVSKTMVLKVLANQLEDAVFSKADDPVIDSLLEAIQNLA